MYKLFGANMILIRFPTRKLVKWNFISVQMSLNSPSLFFSPQLSENPEATKTGEEILQHFLVAQHDKPAASSLMIHNNCHNSNNDS